jgi:hypothetical protein
MAVPKGLSRILCDVAPKRISKATNSILKILFKINNVLSEINSIDFCNPLGYIISKALPPGGLLEAKLLKYGKDALDFVNRTGDNLNPLRLESETPQSGDTPEQIAAKDKAYKDRIQSYQASIEEN